MIVLNDFFWCLLFYLEEGEGIGVGSPAPRQLLHRRPANVPILVVAGAVLEDGEGVQGY